MNNPYQNPHHRTPQILSQSPQQQQPWYDQRGPQVVQGNPSYSKPNILPQQYQMNGSSRQSPNTNINIHAQSVQQYANGPGPQGFEQGNAIYFPPPQSQLQSQYQSQSQLQHQPTALTPPPKLRQQRLPQEVPVEGGRRSNMMSQSRNQNEGQMREILWGQQQQASAFWQQKFFLIYEKFEWFGSRFQMLKSQYIALSEQLLTVDSEEDWNELKQHHEEFAEKLEEMFQELIAVADENQQLINQRLEQDDGVWQRRYHELLSNFKALQEKSSTLELENQQLKSSHQGEHGQQQNYPQLLSHYRSLEEEYEKLYNAYNKLQEDNDLLKAHSQANNAPTHEDFENMRLEYQRSVESIHAENDALKAECQGFYEENQHLRQQLQIQTQNYGQTQLLEKALHQKQQIALNLEAELQQWKRNYEGLDGQVNEMVQRESNKAQEIILGLQKQIYLYKQQALSKESQYNMIAKKLQEELKTRQQLVEQYHQDLNKALKAQADRQTRARQTLQIEIKTLQQEIQLLAKKSGEKELSRYQLEMQEKRIALLKEENQQLLHEIRFKNQELSALRNMSLQVTSYENVLEHYKTLEKEKLTLEETNRNQHSQLIHIKKKLVQIEQQFSEYRTMASSSALKSSSTSHAKQLQSQLAHQQQQVLKLQSEVSKHKKLLQAKQSYIRNLEEENTKSVVKLEYQDRAIQCLKQDHQTQIITLEKRIEGLQKRNKAHELEFRKEIVENYQREIKQLRQANEEKLKKLKKLQNQLHQLNAKSIYLERYSSSHNSEVSMLQSKLANLDSSNSDLLSKLTLARSSIQALEQQLSSFKEKQTTLRSQLSSYTIQLQQADNLIKSKNNIIVQYQNQMKDIVEKVAGLEGRIESQRKQKFDKIKKYEEEIQKLKDRLYSNNNNGENRHEIFGHQRYSSSYTNRYLTFGTKQPLPQQRNQEILKMQATVIEQLNQQNSKLRQDVLELTKKVNSLESFSRVVATNLEQPVKHSPSKSRISNLNAPQQDNSTNSYLEERLAKFNQRLQHCIQDNQLIAVRNVDMTASRRIANYEQEKRELQISYEKKIKSLKEQIKNLNEKVNFLSESASAQPAQQQLADSDLKEFNRYNIMNEQAQKSAQEQLEFLRSKLTQQEKTNSALIKLNEHLKKQLQELFQRSSFSTAEYYKLQWKQCDKSLDEEKQKNKKLTDENKRLKHENIEHDTKLIKEYELKIFNIELQLKELERENTYYKLLKTKAQNEKANLLHDVNVYSADLETIKSSAETKVHHYEKITSELRQKCSTLEKQLYEVNNNGKSLNQANSRLQDSNHRLKFSSSSKRLGV